jgi:hypothetical protein
MPAAPLDLRTLLARLADRRQGRTEANVQSDLHMLLTLAPLDLGDDDLQDIVLEQPAGQRRRIDVEAGLTVFEVKRDLRVGNVRAEAVEQLTGYVADRTATMRQRYVGVLTDGAEWRLYHLAGGTLTAVSTVVVDPASPDVEGLCVWLEGVLATAERITPTPQEIARRLGADSPAHALVPRQSWFAGCVVRSHAPCGQGMPPLEESSMRKRYTVVLSEAERARLHTLIGQGAGAARALTHARILLKADQGEAGPGWTDPVIADALEVHPATVARVRQHYATAGLDAALYAKTPQREYRRKLDGEQEARLAVLACSTPPEGHKRWTLRLLADRLVELEIVESVSYETVRQVLQQTASSRG